MPMEQAGTQAVRLSWEMVRGEMQVQKHSLHRPDTWD